MSAATTHAATPQLNAGELLREVDRLRVVGHVLYVAAHPDDENTRLLAWLINVPRVHAGYLSLTRGEGGQNLLGPEQAPLLGLIRTQELLAARELDHAEQLFGGERDFGYSKTAEETLGIWGKDAALGDLVFAIRKFQPEVILTRFSPEDRATHGHHTASAMLALEAFHAAADPKRFPEQLSQVAPWQAKRIVWNKGVWGQAKPGETDGFLKMDLGAFDPVLGTSWGELAAKSRSMHKSQGFGALPVRGPLLEYFKVLAGDPIQASFLDGVDLSWSRVKGAEKLSALLEKARLQFDARDPSASLPNLFEASDALDALPDFPWKAQKRVDLDRVIVGCAALYLDSVAAEATVVPGGEFKTTLTAINRRSLPVTLKSARVLGQEIAVNAVLAQDVPWTLEKALTLPVDTAFSSPYWLANEPTAGRWQNGLALQSMPEQPAAVPVEFNLVIQGHALKVTRPVVFSWLDPIAGERRRSLEIVPAATVSLREPLLVFPDATPKDLRLTVRAPFGPLSCAVVPSMPSGFTVDPRSASIAIRERNGEQELVFKVTPPAKLAESESAIGRLSFAIVIGGALDAPLEKLSAKSITRVDYAHIPQQTIVKDAVVKLVRLQLKRALTRVGYIPGAGDEVAQALRQAGYEVTVLSEEALTQPLGHFEAIVVGVRAFNTDSRLQPLHAKLMEYVEKGGVLVAQYSTQNRISKVAGQIGPWPFNISQDRVTDETAAVERTLADHAVFRGPNKIGDKDFEGWIQERGLYFADTWDDHYQAPISMHDPGEPARKGSLLVGRHGKGLFVYTGLAFFRQLPAGVPGAYRLFANLLARP